MHADSRSAAMLTWQDGVECTNLNAREGHQSGELGAAPGEAARRAAVELLLLLNAPVPRVVHNEALQLSQLMPVGGQAGGAHKLELQPASWMGRCARAGR